MPGSQHFGSGALFGEYVLFVVPKHLFEHVYIGRDKQQDLDFVSNSLCFCLNAIGASEKFMSILEKELVNDTHRATRLGAYLSLPLVAADERFLLYRMMYHNFILDAGGGIRLQHNYQGRNFKSFCDYKGYLSQTLKRVFDNGASVARKRQLTPLTSVSRGYDSPAVSTLAVGAGCRDAATLAVSVGEFDDCGTEIGKCLGLNVHEFKHVLGSNIQTLVSNFSADIENKASEFIATAGHGDDICFLGFEPSLRDRVFLTGALGDSVWPKHPSVHAGLPVRTRFGKSLTEFRLRVGFAHVPVPVIGGMLPRSILAISKSGEMAPFSIGGDYDRPIPRRICEDAGIPRSAFGIMKRATAPDPINRQSLWRRSVERTMKRYDGAAQFVKSLTSN
jgi:hypothetical protein